jgi:hypothetical protein
MDDHGSRFAYGLTDRKVEELRAILREACGEDLTLEQAWTRAIQLVALFRALLGSLPEERGGAQFELPPS